MAATTAAASCVTIMALAAALAPFAVTASTTSTSTTTTTDTSDTVTTNGDSRITDSTTVTNIGFSGVTDSSITVTTNGTNDVLGSSTEPPTTPDNATCTTDHRVSPFPIRLIKCNIADLTCFREGKYVYGGGADGIASGNEPRCTGLWSQGPCDKFEWLVVDKARFYATGYIRTTCVAANLCPKGYVMMGFDGNCYSNKEVAVNCPKVKGFKLTYNVFGEGECVCGKRREMPVRYCDTVAVGGVRPVTPQLRRMQQVPGVRMY